MFFDEHREVLGSLWKGKLWAYLERLSPQITRHDDDSVALAFMYASTITASRPYYNNKSIYASS